jgi:hypothetical protein
MGSLILWCLSLGPLPHVECYSPDPQSTILSTAKCIPSCSQEAWRWITTRCTFFGQISFSLKANFLHPFFKCKIFLLAFVCPVQNSPLVTFPQPCLHWWGVAPQTWLVQETATISGDSKDSCFLPTKTSHHASEELCCYKRWVQWLETKVQLPESN